MRLRISPPVIKLAASNFARWFMSVLGMECPILGNFAPPEAKNPTNFGARFENMFFSKKGTVSKGRVSGHPGHPLDPPLQFIICHVH